MPKLACFTMDLEGDIASGGRSVHLFEKPDQLAAFREMAERHGVKFTAFLLTKLIEDQPRVVEAAAANLEMEFESHSHTHNTQAPCSPEEVDATIKSFESFFGRRPRGYRAPNGLMDDEGLKTLMERDFLYDASVFPSARFDSFAYNNLDRPITPYQYRDGNKSIIELPLGVVPRVRLVVSISYIKLLGFGTYRSLIATLGLPDILLILCHPYDFFVQDHLPNIKGWKRYAHARNAGNALSLMDRLCTLLRARGYEFAFLSDIVEGLDGESLPEVVLD